MEVKEVMKETIIKWNAAVELHNSGKYIEAVETYGEIKETSARIQYNCACAYAKLDNADFAIQSLSSAIERDEHLAVAFFQRGTLYLQHKSAEKAVSDLETALKLLRGNTHIDYKPLGLNVRLNSIQIRFNLALAYAFVGRVVDAHILLTEGLYDADELQSRSIKSLQDKINENRQELVSAMQISQDKVFTPPNHVTQNLEKKEIVRRAKVVSAINADDRSAAFDGSKRVRVLKEILKSSESPNMAAKRFVTNKQPQPRNRSTSVFNEEIVQGGMKKSKSTSDLTVGFSSANSGPKSPIIRIKGFFQKKRSDSTTDQPRSGLRLNSSFGDFNTSFSPPSGSDGKRSPRSPLAGVRKLLNNKRKGQSSEHKGDDMPLIVMRGNSSNGDLGKHDESTSISNHESLLEESIKQSRSTSDLYEKLRFDSHDKRKSFGSLSGDYLTVTRHGSSLSCDILTAIVTPAELENDQVENAPDQDLSATDGNEHVLKINKEQSVHEYVNTRLKNSTESLSQSNTREPELNETSKFNTTANSKDQITDIINVKKQRPPPPSYPPPPLPPKIVITVIFYSNWFVGRSFYLFPPFIYF